VTNFLLLVTLHFMDRRDVCCKRVNRQLNTGCKLYTHRLSPLIGHFSLNFFSIPVDNKYIEVY